jgi:hypothetical protein
MATNKLVERITMRVFCHGQGGGNGGQEGCARNNGKNKKESNYNIYFI